MSDTTPKPPCAVCRGGYKEHFDGDGKKITAHAYTEQPGDLRPQPKPQPAQNPIRLVGAQTNEAGAIGRLCEVLLQNGLIDTPEALYVAGMGTKPEPESPSQWSDPNAFFLPTPGGGI
jgi:hypothetical protein